MKELTPQVSFYLREIGTKTPLLCGDSILLFETEEEATSFLFEAANHGLYNQEVDSKTIFERKCVRYNPLEVYF
ncbi:MAG: hypothetical protein RR744_10520 [Cellulosilyticaceae bacterium]